MDGAYAIPLNDEFRFVHEPLSGVTGDHRRRFVGRDDELSELASRIVLSEGGAFLLTGYRGVGKSTFVNRVVQEVSSRLAESAPMLGSTELIDVHLNIPRKMDAVELMFHILRGLYRRLTDTGVLARLDTQLRDDLELAFRRTSQSIAVKQASALEGVATLGLGGLALAGGSGDLGVSAKRSRTASREMAYLAYDDKTAEYDAIHVARGLMRGYLPARSWAQRMRDRLSAHEPPRTRLKILFIFDELDKIEESGIKDADAGGRNADEPGGIDGILANLKTLFTTSGICFLFVAGRGTHDRWLEDVGLGDSIYESVFSYARYLPPLWTQADQICDPFLHSDAFGAVTSTDQAAAYASFKKFLAFSGRGIPRRILRKFNERVRWDGRRPVLSFSSDDLRQFRFFADLHDVLGAAQRELLGELQDDGTGWADRQRLALFYLVDWVLLRGVEEFGVADAVAASRRLSRLIAPGEQAAPQLAARLLSLLREKRYLESVSPGPVSAKTPLIPASSARYRLTRKRLIEMGSLVGVLEPDSPSPTAVPPPRFGGRYEVLSVLARGGMSTVYLAQDLRVRRHVVIKEQGGGSGNDPAARQRFAREAEILSGFVHEQIVRVHDADMDAVAPYLVLEHVDGVPLSALMDAGVFAYREIESHDAAGSSGLGLCLARGLVGAVNYLHQHGVLWLDAKPGNVMVTPEGRVVLIDFGAAQFARQPAADTGVIIGTPIYISPEQLRGERVDERADIYSLGVILYQLFTGELPFAGDPSSVDTAMKRLSEPPRPLVAPHLSDAVHAVILRCLDPDPDRRFRQAGELLAALPEGAAPLALGRLVAQVATRPPTRDAVDYDTRTMRPPGFSQVHGPAPTPAPRRLTPSAAPAPPPALVMPSPSLTPAFVPARLMSAEASDHYLLDRPEMRIGRGSGNDVVIDEPTASRFHALLTRTRDGWTLTDQNSRYGTTVNETPLTAPRLLRDGDVIGIGNTRLGFADRAEGGAEPAAPRLRQRDLSEWVEGVVRLGRAGRLDELLAGVLDAAIHLAHAERGFVMLASDASGLEFSAGRTRGGVPLPGKSFSISRKIPDEVFASGQERIVTDLLDNTFGPSHSDTVAIGIRHVLCLPLTTPGLRSPRGVLYLDTRERGGLVADDVRTGLRVIAAAAADALTNLADDGKRPPPGGLRDPDLIAQALAQRGAAPVFDRETAEWQFALRIAPGRSDGELGDSLLCGDHDLAVLLLDVSGRGQEVALLAGHLRRLVAASTLLRRPAALLAELNNRLLNLDLETRFAVMFYGVLDAGAGRFTYSSAGHVPPLMRRGAERITLDVPGVPLGLFAGASYDDRHIDLEPGDKIVGFTADVVEAENAEGREFGEAAIRQLMGGDDNASELADAILNARLAFGSGDGVIAIVLTYRGPAPA